MASVDVVERTTVSVKSAFSCIAVVAFMGVVAFLTLFYTYQSRITKLEEQMISLSQKVEQQDKHIREIMDLRIKQVAFVDEQETAYKISPSRKH